MILLLGAQTSNFVRKASSSVSPLASEDPAEEKPKSFSRDFKKVSKKCLSVSLCLKQTERREERRSRGAGRRLSDEAVESGVAEVLKVLVDDAGEA